MLSYLKIQFLSQIYSAVGIVIKISITCQSFKTQKESCTNGCHWFDVILTRSTVDSLSKSRSLMKGAIYYNLLCKDIDQCEEYEKWLDW